MSATPLTAEVMLTQSSGSEVPIATMVRPMSISDMFSFRAIFDAPSVRVSALARTMAMLIIIPRYSMFSFLLFENVKGCFFSFDQVERYQDGVFEAAQGWRGRGVFSFDQVERYQEGRGKGIKII